ncbi:uncharacterized protein EAF02_001126 [Botrytis sinoallii]|uniref:uncharacterized protein n=1 Tax=Botrytis sinoallii TaxID=1463999 RepID=UPI0019009F65|nr:uncharacterized protein EAF02_001126 [Botrytis sinoallii]KAF7893588.1 hypothetical protein EAF02_001126 [Botrytis sinoallii]
MPTILSGLKKLKERRAHAKELRAQSNELHRCYQDMKAVDDRYNKPQTYHVDQFTHTNGDADKLQDLRATIPREIEIRPSSDLSARP